MTENHLSKKKKKNTTTLQSMLKPLRALYFLNIHLFIFLEKKNPIGPALGQNCFVW